MRELDVTTSDGRTLRVHDRGGDGAPILWLHGTPNLGPPPRPLFAAADRLGLRWIGYDRPGYGGSTPRPGRDVASAAGDATVVLDALGIERAALLGHSGGASHALAVAALAPGRTAGVVAVSGLAPRDEASFEWFAGMAPGSAAALGAAAAGRAAKERHESIADVHADVGFVQADLDALDAEWGWFMEVVGPAVAAGPAALVDDDLASVGPWGFAPEDVGVAVRLVAGGLDRMVPPAHSRRLAERIPGAALRIEPDHGHVSVLRTIEQDLEALAHIARGGR